MMRKTMRYTAWLWLFLVWTAPAWCREAVELDTVHVLGRQEPQGGMVPETIEPETLMKPVVGNAADYLELTPGLDVQGRSVMTPKSSQVRIRGLDERRSLILLDGRPLNGTGVMGGQFVDWSSLSTWDWERIEVGRGAFSARYGNTLGGTVNLVPRPMGEELALSADLGLQSHGTFACHAAASGGSETLAGRASVGFQETGGYLRNSQARRTDVSTGLEWRPGDFQTLSANLRYSDGEFHMPVENSASRSGYDSAYPESIGSYLVGPGIRFPTGDSHGDGSRYAKKRYEADLGYSTSLGDAQVDVKVYVNSESRRDRIYSYDTGELVLIRESEPDRSWGWTSGVEQPLGNHLLGLGAMGNYQGYKGTDILYEKSGYFPKSPSHGSDEKDGTRRHGLYVDDQWQLGMNVSLYAGLRLEDYYGDRQVDRVTGYNGAGKPTGWETAQVTFDEAVLLPKLGLTWTPAAEWSFHARAGRATRFPDNPAFYWYYGGYRPEVDPNSSVERKPLTYEDALQYELGASYRGLAGIKLRCQLYHYRVTDYIRWIFGYAPSRVVYNIDRVDFSGVELALDQSLNEHWSWFANTTWQQTQKQGDVLDGSNQLSDSLSELPRLKANAGLIFARDNGLTARLTLRWVEDRKVPHMDSGAASEGTPVGQTVTLKELEAFTRLDLALGYPLTLYGETFQLNCGVENLLDESYSEEYGFPSPGRTFYGGVSWKL